jgi:hypothetical protein
VKTRLTLMNIEKKQTKSRKERQRKEQKEYQKRKLEAQTRVAGETPFTGKPREDVNEKKFVGTGRSIVNTPTEFPLGHAFDQEKEFQKLVDEDKKLAEEGDGKKKKKKKSAIITNIHSRLKSLDFLLMAKKRKLSEYHDTGVGEADHPVRQQEVSAEQETHNTPTDLGHFDSASGLLGEKDSLKPLKQRKRDKRGKKKADEKQGTSRVHQAEQKELDQAMGTIPGQTDAQTTRKRLGIARGAARFQKKGQLKNIETRVGISDFLLRSNSKKKDGEFGGMNTGEVEWTEPRDTANSRTKRDKDVA